MNCYISDMDFSTLFDDEFHIYTFESDRDNYDRVT